MAKKSRFTIKPRNVSFGGTRTSIRLEPPMWDALEEIAKRKVTTIDDICDELYDRVQPGQNFTSALRVYILQYYRKRAA